MNLVRNIWTGNSKLKGELKIMLDRKVMRYMFAALAVLLIYSQSTFAQQEKGDKELQLNGFFSVNVRGPKDAIGVIDVGLGYFITRRSEIGGGADIVITRTAGSGFDGDAGVRGFYRYNFTKSGQKAYPYVGFDVFTFSVRHNPADFTFARPNVGFKYFFKKNAAFDLNAGYGFGIKEPSNGIVDARFGLAFIF